MSGTDRPLPGKFYDKGGIVVHAQHPDFGAKGDGVTDDTNAIIAAIAYAKANGLRTVVLGNGVFKITSTITLGTANKGISLVGVYPTSKQQGSQNPACVLKWFGGASIMIDVTSTFHDFWGICFQNAGTGTVAVRSLGGRTNFHSCQFQIDNVHAAFSRAGVEFTGVNYDYFDDCEFGFAPGVLINATANCTRLLFDKCMFEAPLGGGSMIKVDQAVNGFDVIEVRGGSINFRVGMTGFFDNASMTSSANFGTVRFHSVEFDGGAYTQTAYIAKCLHVKNLVVDSCDISYFSQNTDSPIQLTDSAASIRNCSLYSIARAVVKTNDQLSRVFVYENGVLSVGNTRGVVDANSIPGNFIPLAVAAGIIRPHLELCNPQTVTTFVVTVSVNAALTVQLPIYTDSSDPGTPSSGTPFRLLIKNATGGAITSITFNSAYKSDGAYTLPANGKQKFTGIFVWDGTNALLSSAHGPEINV